MFDATAKHVKENLPKIKAIIMNDKVTLFFLPSAKLRKMVSDPSNLMFKDMPDRHKLALLTGEGIFIQKKMVWKWINGELDSKNAFILANGEIRVFDDNYKLITGEE